MRKRPNGLKYYREGEEAAKQGKNKSSNPYSKGSGEYQAWATGWHDYKNPPPYENWPDENYCGGY